MLRDLCIARNGSWSANQILGMASFLGYTRHRNAALQEIKAAIGDGTRGRGRPAVIGTEIGTLIGTEIGTRTNKTGDEKRKERSKEKKSALAFPQRAKALLSPEVVLADPLDDIEGDVRQFVAHWASLNASGTISGPRAATIRSSLRDALAKFGRDRVVFAIRRTIEKGANKMAYFDVVVSSADISTRIGTPASSKQREPDAEQLAFAADMAERQARR